jgi:hypothetical protein
MKGGPEVVGCCVYRRKRHQMASKMGCDFVAHETIGNHGISNCDVPNP